MCADDDDDDDDEREFTFTCWRRMRPASGGQLARQCCHAYKPISRETHVLCRGTDISTAVVHSPIGRIEQCWTLDPWKFTSFSFKF